MTDHDQAPWRDCRCGHPRAAHTHPRAGFDCRACLCARYRSSARRGAVLTAVLAVLCLVCRPHQRKTQP